MSRRKPIPEETAREVWRGLAQLLVCVCIYKGEVPLVNTHGRKGRVVNINPHVRREELPPHMRVDINHPPIWAMCIYKGGAMGRGRPRGVG